MFAKVIRTFFWLIFPLISMGAFSMPRNALAQETPLPPSATIKEPVTDNQTDLRPRSLQLYLEKRNSPLSAYADTFIAVADKYQLDWRLVPAITGLESYFAKHYVQGSYNAYGWGGGYIYFSSWEDSIEQVSAALKQNYIDKGAGTLEQIGRIYAPPTPTWASHIRFFINDIGKTYQAQSALHLTL